MAPAFALKLSAESVSEAEIDLTGLRRLFCGSEPIHPAVLAESPPGSGFGPVAHGADSCYGLGEATLFVTGKRAGKRVRVDDGVVSSGIPAAGHQVFVVDPDTEKRCGEGKVGAIWVRGPSVATGYHEDSSASEAVFRTGPHRDALRTGTSAGMRAGGLFVTTRTNGLIVVAGRNPYPQDIEMTVNTCHRAVFCSVAFPAFPARHWSFSPGGMATQGPLLFWVATHRRHRRFADHKGDPHSSNLHGTG